MRGTPTAPGRRSEPTTTGQPRGQKKSEALPEGTLQNWRELRPLQTSPISDQPPVRHR